MTVIEGGFPHSEIRGSKLVRSSPRHIAAYHVLHRLSAPRHPPNALKTLDRSHRRCPLLDTARTDRKDQLASLIHSPHGLGRMHLLFTMFVDHVSSRSRDEFFSWTSRRSTEWWSQTGSNRRPPACKAGALPAELWPRRGTREMVGLGRLERPTSPLSGVRSNHLSYRPNTA